MTTETAPSSRLRTVLQRWPAVAGLAFAAFNAFGMTSGMEQAPVLVAATVIYVGAAAVGRRNAAWPLFLGTVVVITVAQIFVQDVEAPWLLLILGGILLVYGLARRAFRPVWALPLQSILMLVFGGFAAIGLLVDPVVGGYLVALGLLAHAGLDVYLFRTNRVVARSMAEFCMVLDSVLAVLIVIAINR